MVLASIILTSGFSAALLERLLVKRPPPRLVRVNYRGHPVPAVGGLAVVGGALVGLAVAIAVAFATTTTLFDAMERGRVALPVVTVGLIVLLGAAGAWDDFRGDERPRGFAGHLGAARGGAVTGGIVKAIVGLVAGAAAGYVLRSPENGIVSTALLIALGANLVNLLDRAPGRAAKTSGASLVVTMIFAPVGFSYATAPLLAALLVTLPGDLRERTMLGDTGANALGAVAGMGLALALPPWGELIGVAFLLGLNVASERWSFSEIIANNRVLARLDQLGRE